MAKNIFLIGPASVGKTTTAKLLAERLGYNFIDVDKEFCERIAPIGALINDEGYSSYCEKNSNLVDLLIIENNKDVVFATPSGYLVHESSLHLVEKHLEVIRKGISVLLLPDKDPGKVVDIIVDRQVNRWKDVVPEIERARFLDRFEKYKNYGDIKIFSLDKPNKIVEEIISKLNSAFSLSQ